MLAGISGVQTGPGATQFTRMPRSARSCASPAVKFWIAPFSRNAKAGLRFVFDQVCGVGGIAHLVQKAQRNVRAFAGKGDGHRPFDPAVGPGDQRHAAPKAARANPGQLA
jgi:hypothetical protein